MKAKRLLFAVIQILATTSLFATTHTWTGAISPNWSNPGNWSPATVPASGDELAFPSASLNHSMTNDFPASFTAGQITMSSNYTLNGNALNLGGDLLISGSTPSVLNVSVKAMATLRIGGQTASDFMAAFWLKAPLDVNGQSITLDSIAEVYAGINGSGSITVNPTLAGPALQISGSGNFTGTINGTIWIGMNGRASSHPDAIVAGGSLFGAGTVGELNVPAFESAFAFGPIHTRTLTLAGTYDPTLIAGGGSYIISVIGSVTLGGRLNTSSLNGAPSPGEQFTIIDNDGTDPVNGTFDGLPEGATLSVGASSYTITYHGGDGNDVVLLPAHIAKAWTGAVSGLWSDPRNWNTNSIPAAGESLLFPPVLHLPVITTNDLPSGFTPGPIAINSGYVLQGNSLTLSHDVTLDGSTPATITLPLKLAASIRFTGTQYLPSLVINGPLDVNGQALTIEVITRLMGGVNGDGTITRNPQTTAADFYLGGSGNFSGTINGPVLLDSTAVPSSHPNATVNGPVMGSGTVGALSIAPGAFLIPSNGSIHSRSVVLAGRYEPTVYFGGDATLHVTGSVTLGGSLVVDGADSALGSTFIIIDNDGTDAVIGTFDGIPEGGTVLSDSRLYRVSYRGGDGNDVTVTRVDSSTTLLSQSSATTRVGESFRITANVLGGPVTGSVSFFDGAALLGSAILQNSIAVFDTTALAAGSHSITARYDGSAALSTSTSSVVTHTVTRGDTTTSLNASRSTATYGDPIIFTTSVRAVAPAVGTPTGDVGLRVENTPIGGPVLSGGDGTFTSTTINAGHHSIIAGYAGDANFNTSTSSSVTLDVAKATTHTEAHAMSNPSAAGGGVLLEVSVFAARPSVAVTGVVTVNEGGRTLAQRTITTSPMTIDAGILPPGEHTLLISFLGSDNFEASSATIVQTVSVPTLSIEDVSSYEGTSGTKVVPLAVRLSAASPQSVSVSYATRQGTAKEGEDFQPAQGTLTFAPGETAKTIGLTIFGDATAEDDEDFRVTLSEPSNATIASAAATITILNDDIGYRASLGNVYATVGNASLTLDVYTPLDAKNGLPLIIWIPSLDRYEPDANVAPPLRETVRGYVVATANYRGASVAHFPAQLDDLKAAVRWLRANAAQFNINPDRIAVWGHGTGAHLASLLGTTGDSVSAESLKEGNPSFSNQVQAVVDWAGVTDIAHLQSDSPASCNANFIAQSQLGGSPSAESPLTFVNSGDAPFLIMHGAADCSVPLAQSQRFYDALRAANVPATLHVIDGAAPFDAYWFSPGAYAEVDAFLDANLKKAAKRRATR
jgi:acetyl esterase/lipase